MAGAAGAIWTGADGRGFGGFFAGGGAAGAVAARLDRAADAGALVAAAAGAAGEFGRVDAVAAGARAGGAPWPGSGVMMLTGGVEEALGNSALVGLPVGIDASAPIAGAGAAAITGGAFQVGA